MSSRSLLLRLSRHSNSYPVLRNSAVRYYASPSTRVIMPIEESMREKLEKEFLPSVLNIRNDSSKHSHHAAMIAQGGASGETHFFVEIVSDAFEGKNQLSRHRAINNLMADEFKQGLHALSLRIKTPAEWVKEQSWNGAASR